MLDVVFLSNLIPPNIKEEVLSKRKDLMSESGESLQWRIIDGLEENLGYPVRIFNHMLVRSFPNYYPEPYIRRMDFFHREGARDINLPYLNVRYIKRLFMGNSLYREILKWADDGSGQQKVILAYSLTPEFTKAVALAKKKNPQIRACAIVADLPEYTVLTNNISFSDKLYLRWMKAKTGKQLASMDSFVLLTEQMADQLVTHQDYMVMEGIATDLVEPVPHDAAVKTILYAGTLHERFGVMHLVRAFGRIARRDIRLILCGLGDSEEQIRSAASEDQRIDFRGQLGREAVLELMSRSDVIVNPRHTEEAFTKYSFPSKNLEALSSGVPFVAYKLPGIPDDYDPYIVYPADTTEEALAEVLEAVCLDRDGLYADRALQARKWVRTCKNARAQARRILDMLEKAGEFHE
jgi:glycosyltransferase involved in cell wall biosynthesis